MLRNRIHRQENKTDKKAPVGDTTLEASITHTEREENIRIIAYSLKKIRTNPIDPYSILNPDTNSDSPSAKSNGVRFVSATAIIIHKIKITGKIAIVGQLIRQLELKDTFVTIILIINKASLIS